MYLVLNIKYTFSLLVTDNFLYQYLQYSSYWGLFYVFKDIYMYVQLTISISFFNNAEFFVCTSTHINKSMPAMKYYMYKQI